MKWSTYNHTPARDLIGQKVRSLLPLSTRVGALPAGTVFTITGKMAGLSLWSEPCLHCGVRLRIIKVSPMDVEIES